MASNDTELGSIGATADRPRQTAIPQIFFIGDQIRKVLNYILNRLRPEPPIRNQRKAVTIEDYRPGYPQFSALQASHKSFHIFRRFETLRVRLLLSKQDQLSVLEKRLNQIDQDEESPLFLASRRLDRCNERAEVLLEIEQTLSSYDELMERTRTMLSFDRPRAADVKSLENWLDGKACITRDETKFLECKDDLITVAPLDDGMLYWLERMVTTLATSFNRRIDSKSDDPRVHIFSQTFADKATQMLLTPLITLLLLAPVMICNAMSTSASRTTVLILSSVAFITTLSLLTRSRTIDLAAAGATYLTVLIVFLNGPNKS